MTTSFADDPARWVDGYFAAVDTLDPDRIVARFGDGRPSFRFGSTTPVTGKPAIRAALADFFANLSVMTHGRTGFWSSERSAVFEADVRYTRTDGHTVVLPCASILRLDDHDQVADFRINMDVAPLFQANGSST